MTDLQELAETLRKPGVSLKLGGAICSVSDEFFRSQPSACCQLMPRYSYRTGSTITVNGWMAGKVAENVLHGHDHLRCPHLSRCGTGY